MPGSAMTALATITLGTAQATVTFSSITQAYRDLRLIVWNSSSVVQMHMQINSDSTNWSNVQMFGSGSAVTSQANQGAGSNGMWLFVTGADITCDILDYSQTDRHKPVLTKFGGSSNYAGMEAGRYQSTTAITNIKILGSGNNIQPGTTLTLYGVSA